MTADLPPGFTVLCVLGDYGSAQYAAQAVGRAGRVIACSPYRTRFHWPYYPDESAVHTCSCRLDALPFLSHAIDAVISPAGTVRMEGFAAEIRRVLTPGGLFVAYGFTEVQTVALCRERSVEAGLDLVDEAAFARRLGVPATVVTARAPGGRRRSP